jgi:hypothetical protein
LDAPLALSVVSVVIALLALTISTVLAARQTTLSRQANHVPVFIDLIAEFRSLDFNKNYDYVCRRLREEHDPLVGIAGLPDPARAALYDVAYFYQVIAGLLSLTILEEHAIVAMLHHRIGEVWKAIEPFVLRERELNSATGPGLFRVLEELAKKSATYPPGSVDTLLARTFHRPARLSNRWR